MKGAKTHAKSQKDTRRQQASKGKQVTPYSIQGDDAGVERRSSR
jgi:hypothetical protein